MGLPLNLSFLEKRRCHAPRYHCIDKYIVDFTVGTYVVATDCPDGNKTRSGGQPLFTTTRAFLSSVRCGAEFNSTFAPNSISIVGSLVTPLSLMYIGINLKQSGAGTLKMNHDTVLALAGRFCYFPIYNGSYSIHWWGR